MADAVMNVEKDVDKVVMKFQEIRNHTENTLDDLIQQIQSYQRDLMLLSSPTNELTEIQCDLLYDNVIKKTRNTISQFSSEHRDIHASVSRIGKVIDKNFVYDYSSVNNEAVFENPANVNILNQVIVEHFLRQGMLEIAEQLTKEAKLDIPDNKKKPFTELNNILDALKCHNLEPALEWAIAHREQLRQQNSNTNLEFKLHRLQFIELLKGGVENQMKLISYARQYFQPLADKHEKEIQALMGSLLYLRTGLQNSPYSYLLDCLSWNEICDIFTRDACALLGLSVESPLTVTINAGCIALPALLNIKHVMQQRQVTNVWNTRDELPIEIDLSRKCHFHSVFACPILRQQSTENNPPMRLVCGHVISRDALNKLSNGTKLKCPYCPMEQNPNDARLIHF
ncbi:E3 ubiquitin-protein ligase RMND5A-like [Oppia nitens]|uniref:E3 ubiquitin-protein ligase RMND5A-like n=1 Tax=Oppia nitens TaxID=1686743 RepID=UPI0023DC4A94|nr:E3 ubiquitin-protein ligase RMND5A-like [Oppia nitens]